MFHLLQPAYHTCEALEHEVSGLSFGTEELNERKRQKFVLYIEYGYDEHVVTVYAIIEFNLVH